MPMSRASTSTGKRNQRRLLVRAPTQEISASLDRRPEDIGVVAVVIAELELPHIERQVLFADLVK
jgi:hypothetical protein